MKCIIYLLKEEMKKEIFRFIYENEAGRYDHFNMSIFYTDDIDLKKHVRACGEDFMKLNAIGGTLYEAHSTESDIKFSWKPKNSPRDWWYEAVFMRLVPDGTVDRRVVRRCYRAPRPLVINRKLIEDFIHQIADYNGNTRNFQLISLYLDEKEADLPINEVEVDLTPEGVPVEKWIRVKDDSGLFSWVPGLMWPDGKVKTIFGDMSNPDSEDDTRDFDNCPFKGWKIVKE